MKKFLTVLLALSVVFTYSFSAVGTVFADDTVTTAPANTQAQYLQNLAKAEAQALNDLTKQYEYAKATVTYNGIQSVASYNISGAEWLKQLDAVYADEQKAIKSNTAALQTGDAYATNGDKTVEELVELYTVKAATALTTALYAADGTYAAVAAKAQFAVDQAKYVSYANSVDTKIYSTTEQADAYPDVVYGKTTVSTKIPKEYADAIIAKVVYDLNAVTLAATDTTAAQIATKAAQLETTFGNVIVVNDAQTAYIIDEGTGKQDILSIAEEKANETQSAADKAALKADLAAKISEAARATTAYDADQLAAWTKLRDAYSTVSTYLIDNGKVTTNAAFPNCNIVKANGETKAVETATHYQDAVAEMEELSTLAATLKVMTTVDGEPAYDAAKIDELLDAAYATQYAAAATASYTKSTEDFDGAKLTYSTSFTKEHEKAVVAAKVDATEMKYDSNAYYALEWAEIAGAVANFNTAVDAAQTVAAIEKAKLDLNTAIGKVSKATDVDKLYADAVTDPAAPAGICNASAVAAMAMVNNYVATANAGKEAKDQIANPFADQAALNKWFAENGARTAAEVTALYEALKAEIAKTPTAGEKEAASAKAVAEVKALIDALPTALNATLADAESVVAAKTAYTALTSTEQGQLTAENTKLTAIIANLESLYTAEIKAKVAEAQKGGITASDAALFDELEKLNDSYKALTGADSADYTTFASTANKDALKTAEKNAVIDAIKALPANITLADKAAVDAAREAYAVYVAKYTDYAAGVNAANDITNITALQMAEAVLKTLEMKEVESLKITAKSSAAKGSITVKWTVKGDTTAADGYEVFRSVKKNSGFTNKAFYTTDKNTKTSYKNTKSLKKGIRYYYKVRAYKVLADGTKVYSDWSNKAYRIAK